MTRDLLDFSRLGGSDAGPIILGAPRTAGDVYLRVVEGIEDPDSFYAAAGRAMESVIREEEERRLGISIRKPTSHLIGNWGRASPDGIIEGCDEGWECKLAWSLKDYGAEGTDEVPPHHLLQCQFYMHVFRLPRWRLTVRPIWASRNQSYLINRNEQLGTAIETRLLQFWTDHIVPKVPPPIQDAALLDSAFKGEYPNAKSRPCVIADESAGHAMEMLKKFRQKEKAFVAMKEQLELTVKNAIGAAAGIEHQGERVMWLRPKPRRSVNWEAVAMQQRLLLSSFVEIHPQIKDQVALIEQNATLEKQQARRLTVPRSWTAVPGQPQQLSEGDE